MKPLKSMQPITEIFCPVESSKQRNQDLKDQQKCGNELV